MIRREFLSGLVASPLIIPVSRLDFGVPRGAPVRHPDGTLMCRLVCNPKPGALIHIEQFSDWRIPKPQRGDIISRRMWEALYHSFPERFSA